MGEFLKLLKKYGVLAPIRTIALSVVALFAFILVVVWVGNPYLDDTQPAAEAAPSWAPPSVSGPTTPNPTLPPGFPTMRPPKLIEVPEGEPQPVPTKYGLTYTVPSGEDWRSSGTAITGWSDKDGEIVRFGAMSDYEFNYCPELDGLSLALVGLHGRNGVEIDAVAREEVGNAVRIFSEESAKPKVEIRGPVALQVSGRPAVRYTAVLTDIPQKHSCEPTRAEFDIVATPAYASAEVAVFMVEHHVGLPNSLSGDDVDTIVASLRKTEPTDVRSDN